MATAHTHWLVVDSHDASVLAWFPKSETVGLQRIQTNPTARERAQRMADDTGHRLTEGSWNGSGWELDGPQGLKDLLRF